MQPLGGCYSPSNTSSRQVQRPIRACLDRWIRGWIRGWFRGFFRGCLDRWIRGWIRGDLQGDFLEGALFSVEKDEGNGDLEGDWRKAAISRLELRLVTYSSTNTQKNKHLVIHKCVKKKVSCLYIPWLKMRSHAATVGATVGLRWGYGGATVGHPAGDIPWVSISRIGATVGRRLGDGWATVGRRWSDGGATVGRQEREYACIHY